MNIVKEVSAISEMLNTAKEHNLEVECVWTALSEIAKIGRIATVEDIEQVCANAISSWDI